MGSVGRVHHIHRSLPGLLCPTGEPVSVGQTSGEVPEDLPPDQGPLLVPLETWAVWFADAPGAVGQADQLGGAG
jgi:hypothetical protein